MRTLEKQKDKFLAKTNPSFNGLVLIRRKGDTGHSGDDSRWTRRRWILEVQDESLRRNQTVHSFLNSEHLRTLTEVQISFLLCCLQIFLGTCFLLTKTYAALQKTQTMLLELQPQVAMHFSKYLLNSIKGMLHPSDRRGI